METPIRLLTALCTATAYVLAATVAILAWCAYTACHTASAASRLVNP